MPFCPICKCELEDTASACPYCGNDPLDSADVIDGEFEESEEDGAGIVDLGEAVLLYKSFSRLNTDFLVETLKSAGIPYYCRLIGGLYGRGMSGSVGIFGTRAVDAEIYVPSEYVEEAIEIRRQTVGDEE